MARTDLNLLAVLEMIEGHGSLTGAAAELHLTQSAVSHALRRLRLHFGDPLFMRRGNTMVPTPLTLSVVGTIRSSLRAMDRTINEARQFDPLTSGRRFTLGLQQATELGLLRTIVPIVAALAPGVELSFVRLYRKMVEADLAAGKLDVAVDVPLALPETVRRRRVASDALVVLAAADHPTIRGSIDETAYFDADHILVSARRRGAGLEDLALERIGARRRIGLRCQNQQAAAEVAAQTRMLLTLPMGSAAALAPQFALQVLAAPVPLPRIELYAYWHALVDGDAAHAWLRVQLFSAFDERERVSQAARTRLASPTQTSWATKSSPTEAG